MPEPQRAHGASHVEVRELSAGETHRRGNRRRRPRFDHGGVNSDEEAGNSPGTHCGGDTVVRHQDAKGDKPARHRRALRHTLHRGHQQQLHCQPRGRRALEGLLRGEYPH